MCNCRVSSPTPLFEVDATTTPVALQTRRPRPQRASAGQRRPDRRVTSWTMRPQDELLLDALRDAYGASAVAEVMRRSLRAAAEAEGIDISQFEPEAAA